MTKVLKRPMWHRVLCLIFSFLLFLMPILVPMANAAVVETLIAKYGVEILATILVGSGIGFASSDGARQAAAGCWDWMETNATSAWNTIKAWSIKALENPGIVSNSGVRMTTSLWNSIESAVSSFRAADGSFVGQVQSVIIKAAEMEVGKSYKIESSYDVLVSVGTWGYRYFSKDGNFYKQYCPDNKISDSYAPDGFYQLQTYEVLSNNHLSLGFVRYSYDFGSLDTNPDMFLSYDAAVSIPSTGDLVYPSDNYLVKMPDIPDVHLEEDGSETVLLPPFSLNPADHLADIPKVDTVTGELVDVPTDVLVDVTTGALTQVGEGEGTGEGEGEGTTTKPNLPSKTDISLPKLIITKFPFSIPFDLYAMLSILAADPIEPVFRVPMKIGDRINYEFVLDFSLFQTAIEVIRWGEYICFLAGLAIITRNVIKW